MKSPETIRIQGKTQRLLGNITHQETKGEWQSFDAEMYPTMSSPKIDVAVGPFAIYENLQNRYTELQQMPHIKRFLNEVRQMHLQNMHEMGIPLEMVRTDDFDHEKVTNERARCFIAVEIEGREDRKVVLADIINTAAMGRIGIVVAKTNRVLRIFSGLLHYNWYLGQVEKPHYTSSNVLLVSSQQFEQLLDRYSPR